MPATERVSVSTGTVEGNSYSNNVSLSGDGRYAVFESYADNLVSADTNAVVDIFLHDRVQATTTIISTGINGEANNNSTRPVISDDGCVIAFQSTASNLVPNDTNGTGDVFVYDCQQGVIERVSVDSTGAEADVGGAFPNISADGSRIVFMSSATNLVPNDTNGATDIFVHYRQGGMTQRVSVDNVGGQSNASSFSPTISGDGFAVAFHSLATNLVTGDSNNTNDVFVHDLAASTLQRVSLTDSGGQSAGCSQFNGSAYASLSFDGRFVAFLSDCTNLVVGDDFGFADVFVRDTVAGTTERVSVTDTGSQANGHSYFRNDISADGRYVVFTSDAYNMVPGDMNNLWDIFVRDRTMGTTERVSVDVDGLDADATSTWPSISADGDVIGYHSSASDLVANDTNGQTDVFVLERNSNSPPYMPSQPLPTDGDVSASIFVDVQWTGGDPDSGDIVTYDLYLGTTNPPSLVAANLATAYFSPPTFAANTTYYWQVIAHDDKGATTVGPLWQFETENARFFMPVVLGTGS